MNTHKNARMTVHGRILLVRRIIDEGWLVTAAAKAAGVSTRTAYKWLARYRAGGERILHDRSSAPARCPRRLPAETVAEIERLRRQRLTGPQIATRLGLTRSTVGAVLRRLGLGRVAALDPKPPVVRYERAAPGELIHIDVKKLARVPDGGGHKKLGRSAGPSHTGGGYTHIHTAIDAYSRLAYSEFAGTENTRNCVAFLDRAVAWFAERGITIEVILTDNGNGYRSRDWRDRCAELGIRHKRTKPYHPATNGKVERFNRTLLDEWAYARLWRSEASRARALDRFLHRYNHHRHHTAIGGPPISRLNNQPGQNT